MSVKLLKVSLGASLVALVGVSWYAFTKEDARGENRSDIANEVSVKTSDLWAKAKEGDTTAFAALKARAEAGDAESQRYLENCYYAGKGISQSYEEGVKWLRKAAEQGNVLASKFLSSCPCETAHLLNVAYEASCNELVKSQQNKEKYLYRLGKVNTALQTWTNLENHLSNCSSCGSEYKSAQMQYLYQTKSQLDAMHTYLENAVNRGLNGDNDSEDALIKIFEALNGMTKPFRNLFSQE